MAPQFIENYGFHDDEFTDGEDTLQYVYATFHSSSGVHSVCVCVCVCVYIYIYMYIY
jgi:hypothetical protein